MRTPVTHVSVARFLPMVAVLMLSPIAYSQDTPALKENPIAALKAFEPAVGQEYELGAGDEITVEVVARPEISGKHTIGPDGEITMPGAGSIKIADMTRAQAADAIQAELSKLYSNAKVSVGVDKYTSNKVILMGAVEHPGPISFEETPTLLEVISRGGQQLTPTAAGGGTQKTSTSGMPEQVSIYRGTTMLTVQLKELVDKGDPLANIRLKRNDIVYVPSAKDRYVSVMGEVGHPGTIQLSSNSTLADLLAEAGGPLDKAGRNPKIQIVSRSTGKSRVIAFNDIKSTKDLDLTLLPGDVIYVPQSGFDHFGYVLQELGPLITAGSLGGLAVATR
jgi:polysaccharide export outer membrane protein